MQALRGAIARIVSAVAKFHRPSARAHSRKTANGPLAPTAAAAMSPAVQNNSNTHYGGVPTALTGQMGDDQPETAAVHPPLPEEERDVVPPMSLNFCVTDGRHIVCSRYRNHPKQEPPSLFFMAGAGFACDKEGSCLRLTAAGDFVCVRVEGWVGRRGYVGLFRMLYYGRHYFIRVVIVGTIRSLHKHLDESRDGFSLPRMQCKLAARIQYSLRTVPDRWS